MSADQANEVTQNAAKAKARLSAASWVVAFEALAVAAFAVFLLWGLVSGQAKSVAAEGLLVALYAAAAAWVGYIAFSLRTGKRWARSAAIFWQTCQLFLASQSFTGRGANDIIGIVLIATSVFVLTQIFSKSVLSESKRQIENEK
jgi:hypothetical protein